LPAKPDEDISDASSETGLAESSGEQERRDDEPNCGVHVAGHRLVERQRLGKHRGSCPDENYRAEGKRLKDQSCDRSEENCEEMPGFFVDSRRYRQKPDNHGQQNSDNPAQQPILGDGVQGARL